MTGNVQRLIKRIAESTALLDEYEEKLLYAENPKERKRCEIEIRQVKEIIQGHKTELSKYLERFAKLMKDDSSSVERGSEFYELYVDILSGIEYEIDKKESKTAADQDAKDVIKEKRSEAEKDGKIIGGAKKIFWKLIIPALSRASGSIIANILTPILKEYIDA